MSEVEFIIEFSDPTMIEADGCFNEVDEIMSQEKNGYYWMIRSSIFMSDNNINSQMTLHLYQNKDVYIEDYIIKKDEICFCPDLQYLTEWAQQSGWNVPRPSKDLLIRDIEFWKYFWETSLIDCQYFDDIYGKREF